jgi:hypothetical protein
MVVPPGMSAPEAKLNLAENLRELFKERDVVRYAHAAECWAVGDDTATGPVVDHPRRLPGDFPYDLHFDFPAETFDDGTPQSMTGFGNEPLRVIFEKVRDLS